MPRKKHHLNSDGTRKTLVQQVAEVKGDAAYHSGRVIGEVEGLMRAGDPEGVARGARMIQDLMQTS